MFSDGQAHVLGPLNGDHWNVFIADRTGQFEVCDDFMSQEQTLNIYMYGIRQEVAQLFMKSEEMILPSIFESKETSSVANSIEISKCKIAQPTFSFVTSAAEATERSGIDL